MRKASIIILLFFLCFSVWGQEFPHVTDINIETRNNLIRLSWVDSPQARGHVYIFRSARPFTSPIPANIRPVVVSYGTQFYIDDTDDLGSLYYFIAASDTAGRRYDGIIPRINSAIVNLSQPDDSVEPDIPEEQATSIPALAMPEAETVEGLSNIKAFLDGEKVIITFNNTNPGRNTILYRSSQPVRRPRDLINAFIVESPHRSGSDSQFIDYPVPEHPWYYALIYEDEVTGGNFAINPGVNTTITAVIVSSGVTAGRAMHPIPLPELTLSDLDNTRRGFLSNNTRQMPLGGDSIVLLQNTPLGQKENLEFKKPRVFVIDLQSPAGGEDSALFQIVKDHFVAFDWENTRLSLRHFLSLPRSKTVEARARFYLGQSLYFSGNYREALMEFLFFKSYNEVEANIWIDAVLTAMVD